MDTILAQKIALKLKSDQNVLLVMHRRPDPDSMGSAAAMAEFLQAHGVTCRYFCATILPKEAVFFGMDASNIIIHNSQLLTFSTVCTFDAGDLKHAGLEGWQRVTRSGKGWQDLPDRHPRSPQVTPFLINFDHHCTNAHFGDLNLVDSSCASTTELLYKFFKAINFSISPKIARYLLAGLLTDTDYFMNPATTASALDTAAELIACGVQFQATRALLNERKSIAALRLTGETLARLKINPRSNIAVTYITDDDLQKYQLDFEDLEGISNLLNSIGDAQAMFLLKSQGGEIRVSMRTTRDGVDVGRLAEILGGGGHKKAAGFGLSGTLQVEGERVRVV